jgi:hypothetical protein
MASPHYVWADVSSDYILPARFMTDITGIWPLLTKYRLKFIRYNLQKKKK